ncbi:MAG: ubiquinone biosynthesis protein [Maribacter sp.]|jgi:ubiquinone biosynthesis protein
MAVIKSPRQKELKRYATLFNILAKYGFEDVLANSSIKKVIPMSSLKTHPDTEKNFSFSKYERIRMVWEELGPSNVKFLAIEKIYFLHNKLKEIYGRISRGE